MSVRNAPLLQMSDPATAVLLRRLQLHDFDALWDLPHDFIEPRNVRRGGWSAVVRVGDADGMLYVKRQENQHRRSLRYPCGHPTYFFEAQALQQWRDAGLPVIPLGAWGSRRENGKSQAILVTAAAPAQFKPFRNGADSPDPYPPHVMRHIGEQLYAMHADGWQHGSLYPSHLFIEAGSGQVLMIDLERARRHRLRPQRAAFADLWQFFRRARWLSDESRENLLSDYRRAMPRVARRLEPLWKH